MLSKETLSRIKLTTETIQSSYDFWLENIQKRAMRLDELCNRDNPDDFPEIEKLSEEIQFWQARGKREEALAKQQGEMISKILVNNLLSGISEMKF